MALSSPSTTAELARSLSWCLKASRNIRSVYPDAEKKRKTTKRVLPFAPEQAGTENTVERFLRLLGLSPLPQAEKRRRRGRSRVADEQF